MEVIRQPTLSWSLRQRRITSLFATTVSLMIWLAGAQWVQIKLGHTAIYSGATLLGCLFGLSLIGARKRLIILPLWSVSAWVQVHIYTGLFACVAFAVHVPTIVANGWFEGPLSWLFLIVAASGFYGVFISRTAPKRLTAVSIQPRFDRISWHRDQLAIAAEEAVSELQDLVDGRVVTAHYQQYLRPYFQSSLSRAYLLYPTGARRRDFLAALGELDRYLEGSALSVSKRLAALIRHRDDLDYQHAIQLRLRTWVMIHGGMSSVLIVWSLVHAYMALAMLGS